jgi:hypothetical protein
MRVERENDYVAPHQRERPPLGIPPFRKQAWRCAVETWPVATHGTAAPVVAQDRGEVMGKLSDQLNAIGHELETTRAELAASAARVQALEGEAMTSRHMREIAQRLGYPSTLEALEDISELRDRLRAFIYETTNLSPEEEDGSHWCKISRECLSSARAALKAKDTTHD